MNKATFGFVVTLLISAGVGLALSGTTGCGGEDECKVGSESCACTSGGSCDTGLSCLSNRCVKGATGNTGGAGGQPAVDPLASFVGTWRYTTGSTMISCGAQNLSEQLSGTFTVQKGVDAPLVIVDDSCTYKMDASGGTATMRAGQMCMEVSMGNSATQVVNAGSMVVTGTNATINHAGNVTLVIGGQTLACRYTTNGTAMKVSL